jgi:hypothetical protein
MGDKNLLGRDYWGDQLSAGAEGAPIRLLCYKCILSFLLWWEYAGYINIYNLGLAACPGCGPPAAWSW